MWNRWFLQCMRFTTFLKCFIEKQKWFFNFVNIDLAVGALAELRSGGRPEWLCNSYRFTFEEHYSSNLRQSILFKEIFHTILHKICKVSQRFVLEISFHSV